jgi:hypothetical protein
MNTPQRAGTPLEALMGMLGNKDGLVRQKARRSLVAVGEPAVAFLTKALRDSKRGQVRWEAAKALGAISDTRSIPAFVAALEDSDADVAWLAAEALIKFKKAAWGPLLQKLIKKGAACQALVQGTHHVLRKQKEDGFNDLLATLKTALNSSEGPETIPLAAYAILRRMKGTS